VAALCAVLLALGAAGAQDAPAREPAPRPRRPVRTVQIRRPAQPALAVGERLPEEVTARRLLPAPAATEPAPLLAGRAPGPFVLVFWSADCPVTRRYDEALANLFKDYAGTVRFALVCANDDEPDDALTAAAGRAGFAVQVLRDPAHAAADRLGVWVTPTVLVFDGEGALRYRGPIDDDRAAMGRETEQHVRKALEALTQGLATEGAEPRAYGSAIPRAP
jgi:hypothetical protein